jgi:hypothetical protein
MRHLTSHFVRTSLSWFLAIFALSFCFLFSFGCGSTASPGGSAPPVFDTGHGEGNLGNSSLVTTFSTATTPSQTGLDTFFTNLICPANLAQQDCESNKTNLDTPDFGNFDLTTDPIANNPAGVQSIDAIKMDYTAINVNGTPVTVSGGVDVPKIASSEIRGIVLYFHGTTTEREYVPSRFTPTTETDDYKDGTLLAALWASQGYVVIMPDYIGLGDDTAEPHPYVAYPMENAQSGLAMVLAAKQVLANYQIAGTLPLFITGYSEGGAYALEAAHLMQQNSNYAKDLNVQLKKAIPLSGFFDLSGTGVAYLFDNISPTGNDPWHSYSPLTSIASKPFLSAYLALSFAHYSGIAAPDILAPDFYNDTCSEGQSGCGNLYDTYFTAQQSSDYDDIVLADAGYHANHVGYTLDANAVTPLLTSDYATALQNADKSNPLYSQLVQADTYRFTPGFPVTLVSLEQDSVVTRVNTDVAYQYFEQQNSKGPYKKYLVPNENFFVEGILADGNIDHLTEKPFLDVLILNQFNTTN